MKAALYARVSTDEQTIENQLPSARAWCQVNNHELTEIYAENESAWKNGHQRELSRLLIDIRSGKRHYDFVIIWALDRLSRQGIPAIFKLIETFDHYGARVVSIQEPWIPTEGPLRDLFIAIAGFIANFDSDRKSARVKDGLARRKAQGFALGRVKGSKDKKPRRKAGYLLRYANKPPVKNGGKADIAEVTTK
jgi:putative DNA-invertase from lambdoid prophage Rac